MRRSRAIWLVLAGCLVVFSLLVLIQPRSGDSADHASDSYGPRGTSALYSFAAVRGHQVTRLSSSFSPIPSEAGLLFVFNPDVQPFSAADVQGLKQWLSAGGVLVYADSDVDHQLRLAFGLASGRTDTDGQAVLAVPALAGAGRVGSDEPVHSWRPSADQVPLFVSQVGGQPVIVEERVGAGRIIAIANPDLLTNHWLGKEDNWRLAADLLAVAPGEVLFDEYHHNPYAGAAPKDWTKEPWGIALLWTLAVGFFGFALRGRSFGPRIQPAGEPDRSSAEYAQAVGSLLRSTGGREVVAGLLWQETQRKQLTRRPSPETAAELVEAKREVAGAGESDVALLRVARRLHRLAYPVTPK